MIWRNANKEHCSRFFINEWIGNYLLLITPQKVLKKELGSIEVYKWQAEDLPVKKSNNNKRLSVKWRETLLIQRVKHVLIFFLTLSYRYFIFNVLIKLINSNTYPFNNNYSTTY